MALREAPAEEGEVLSRPILHSAILLEDRDGVPTRVRDGEVRPIHITHAEIPELYETVAEANPEGLPDLASQNVPVRTWSRMLGAVS